MLSVSTFLSENCEMTERMTPMMSSAMSTLDISLDRAWRVVEVRPENQKYYFKTLTMIKICSNGYYILFYHFFFKVYLISKGKIRFT